MDTDTLPPVHLGAVLREDFLKLMGISQYRFAKAIGVLPRRVNEIVQGKRAVTTDTTLRLARYFGTSMEVWMGLQADDDVEKARAVLGARLDAAVLPYAA